ncbi:MAG: ribonuclease HII [Lachnospiraceae bacterium]|nr:ribonuclease HII [Lachnospiraceae bacterium]
MDENERLTLMTTFERKYSESYVNICGIDEAGRGPLAGPVVAAAVILPTGHLIPGVNDSKKLTEKKREKLFDVIMEEALAVGVGISDHKVIDEINILQATYRAMREAIDSLSVKPDLLLCDAVEIPDVDIPQVPIVKGDAKSLSIAAASIIAKVTRDRMMRDFDEEYPGYGFAGHKGYGTKAHYAAIEKLGISPIHRYTFLQKRIDSGKLIIPEA